MLFLRFTSQLQQMAGWCRALSTLVVGAADIHSRLITMELTASRSPTNLRVRASRRAMDLISNPQHEDSHNMHCGIAAPNTKSGGLKWKQNH